MKRKIIISSICTLIAAAGIYTAAWFIIANQYESAISKYIAHATNQPSLKDVSYKLDTSCFPKMCVSLSDLKIKSQKYFAQSKEGVEFSMFKEHPLVLTKNNIFSSKFSFEKTGARYDITSTSLDTNMPVLFYIDANNLDIQVNKGSFDVNVQGLLVQVTTQDSPLKALLDIQQASVTFTKKVDDKLANFAVSYKMTNAKSFAKAEEKVAYEVNHSEGSAYLTNIDKNLLAKSAAKNQDSMEFAVKAVEDFAKNKTAITIPKFRHTDQNVQLGGKALVFIDENLYLLANADLNVFFRKQNTPLEQILKAYGFTKNEENAYKIEVRTNNFEITVNNIITMPSPNFKQ